MPPDSQPCGKSLTYSVVTLVLFLLPLASNISDAHSTTPAHQCIVLIFGCWKNQCVVITTHQTMRGHEEDTPAWDQHMHQRVRAPGIKMMHQRTCLGLFRTWGKTWEVGDPLGEPHISFRTLSITDNPCFYIYKLVTLSLQVTTSPITTCPLPTPQPMSSRAP